MCYVKAESVEMATNVLHEGQIRPGVTIEASTVHVLNPADNFNNGHILGVARGCITLPSGSRRTFGLPKSFNF